MIRGIYQWFGHIVTVLLVIAVVFCLYNIFQLSKNPYYIPSIIGLKPMSVLTGSMRPVLNPGDLIIVGDTKASSIETNDIITYRMGHNHALITHRVVEVFYEDDVIKFRTKGDANNTEDLKSVSESQLIGKMILKIPYAGYIAQFVRTPKGLFLFILVPIILVSLTEVKSILSVVNNKSKIKER